jgi:adenine deaminase
LPRLKQPDAFLISIGKPLTGPVAGPANPDLVIRGGTTADGRDGDLFEADIAIKDGRISEVGKFASQGREEIDRAWQTGYTGLCRCPHSL